MTAPRVLEVGRALPARLVVLIAAIGLLVSGTIGVGAQDETADPLAPASFRFEYEQTHGSDVVRDEEAGADLFSVVVLANDPRASGVLTMANVSGGVRDGDHVWEISTQSMRLANDAGAWTGTGIGLQALSPDERTRKQRRKDQGPPPLNDVASVYRLTGDGEYDGLALFLVNSDHQSWGIIVPSDTVPAIPELRTEDTAAAQAG